jgi:hypothetical protein
MVHKLGAGHQIVRFDVVRKGLTCHDNGSGATLIRYDVLRIM